MARKRVSTTSEDSNGRNRRFKDNYTGDEMYRCEFVDKIKRGKYPGYHTRDINGVETPVSNPDGSKNNNLD